MFNFIKPLTREERQLLKVAIHHDDKVVSLDVGIDAAMRSIQNIGWGPSLDDLMKSSAELIGRYNQALNTLLRRRFIEETETAGSYRLTPRGEKKAKKVATWRW